MADAAWAGYERDGNKQALATRHARFFRSAFILSLALGLAEAHDAGQRSIFADRFEKALTQRLAKDRSPVHSFVQIFVVTKSPTL